MTDHDVSGSRGARGEPAKDDLPTTTDRVSILLLCIGASAGALILVYLVADLSPGGEALLFWSWLALVLGIAGAAVVPRDPVSWAVVVGVIASVMFLVS